MCIPATARIQSSPCKYIILKPVCTVRIDELTLGSGWARVVARQLCLLNSSGHTSAELLALDHASYVCNYPK